MRNLRCISFLLCCFASGPLAFAADGDSGAWSTISLNHFVTPTRQLTLDLQTRHADDFGSLERFLIRPYLSWWPDKTTRLTLGYDAHFVETPRDLLEHRIWQRAEKTYHWGLWSSTVHLWLEQRFIEGVSGVAVRVRPAAQIKRALGNGAYVRLQNEIHLNMNSPERGPSSGLDQNRLIFATGLPLGENVGIEAGYLMQFLDRPNDVLRHHLMLTLKIKIPD